jgi:polyhydroxybutyrate depolymerase
MKRWLVIFALLVLVGSVAAEVAPGFVHRTHLHDGIQRSYLLRTPSGGSPPKAIVVMLHGHAGSAEQLTGRSGKPAPYRRWNAIADREGLLLVAPQGVDGGDGKSGWNDCRADADSNPTTDDAAFIAAVVTALRREYAVPSNRVYVLGTSNGGNMALRMAIERPDMIAAAAAIVASMPSRSECAAPTRAVPMLFMNGTDDPLMPFAGGQVGKDRFQRGSVLSAEASVALWARLAGAASTPRTTALPDRNTADGSRVMRKVHANAQGRNVVMLYRIEGGGHLEPSRTQRYPRWLTRILGRQNGDIEMAEEVWAFFVAQTECRAATPEVPALHKANRCQ